MVSKIKRDGSLHSRTVPLILFNFYLFKTLPQSMDIAVARGVNRSGFFGFKI